MLVRLIRDGIVVYEGELGSLKRFKDDAKEVLTGADWYSFSIRIKQIWTSEGFKLFDVLFPYPADFSGAAAAFYHFAYPRLSGTFLEGVPAEEEDFAFKRAICIDYIFRIHSCR